MKRCTISVWLAAVCAVFLATTVAAQRRPAPPPSRYGYTFDIDAKSLPKGVTVRTVRNGATTRHFIKNTSQTPLVVNERYHLERLVGGTKLVSSQVYQYFPNGVRCRERHTSKVGRPRSG